VDFMFLGIVGVWILSVYGTYLGFFYTPDRRS
jgi:hypothetical protein